MAFIEIRAETNYLYHIWTLGEMQKNMFIPEIANQEARFYSRRYLFFIYFCQLKLKCDNDELLDNTNIYPDGIFSNFSKKMLAVLISPKIH